VRVTVLAGGVGGARFVAGVRSLDADVSVVVNTGDDLWLTGLRVCPDLDSIMYALAGVNDRERGWGRAGETERISAELAEWGLGWPWFTLGDLDLATHIARTSLLRDGLRLTEVTSCLAARWPLGVRLLPATDDEVETHVLTEAGDDLHFEEWWVRTRAAERATAFVQRGVERASATPEVLAAIESADVVLLAPSNPVVSIGTVLGIPGIRSALASTAAPVVGVSPIIGGAVMRGMADACLTAIGVETDAAAVAQHYGARRDGGLLDGWLVDHVDAAGVAGLRDSGIAAAATGLWMTDAAESARIARAAIELVRP
jgi:LPPG:FO 2-phospho-L-lactate transferase